MRAVALPQPWAGLLVAGQLDHINSHRASSYRGELAIYATGQTHEFQEARLRYRLLTGVTDVHHAFLGLVQVTGCSDAYECDALAFMGQSWFWHVQVGDMLIDPIAAPRQAEDGRVFTVPRQWDDAIDGQRIGWSKWWDRVLADISKAKAQAQQAAMQAQQHTAGE